MLEKIKTAELLKQTENKTKIRLKLRTKALFLLKKAEHKRYNLFQQTERRYKQKSLFLPKKA
jgi:hypothetical protein